MSHNTIKVGNVTPTSTGLITPSLAECTDISGTPSDGDLLQYSSASNTWTPQTVANSSSISYIWWGHGESENYSYSPASSFSSQGPIYVYDTAGVNTISGATVSTTATTGAGGGEWLDGVTLPIGVYRFQLVSAPLFSSTGYFSFYLRETTSGKNVTCYGTVGTSTATVYATASTVAVGIYEFSAQTTVNILCRAVSGVDSIANQGDAMSTSTTLFIEKLA